MKRIEHDKHPNWQQHLKDLIDEKWEKKDKRFNKVFVIPGDPKTADKAAKEAINEYFKTELIEDYDYIPSRKRGRGMILEQIEDFTIHTSFNENFDLIVDVRMSLTR